MAVGVGRFLCVGFPIILTIAAIVSMLIATLSGVAHNRMSLFSLDTEDLSFNEADIDVVVDKLFDINRRDNTKSNNITAQNLGLAREYDVNLWGFCWTDFDKKDRHCTDAKFDWASDSLNTTYIENFGSVVPGVTKIKIPDEIKGALKAFRTVSKWTQVATIIALVALVLELVLGIFSNFSRAISCVTWLVAGIATTLTGVAAGLATAQAVVVVGAVESTAKYYGVRGEIGGRYLATIWLSFAFAVGAGMFWLFTVCCCAPDRSSPRKNKHASSSGEKLFGTNAAYAPLGNDHEMQGGIYNQSQPPTYSAPRYPDASARHDMAYEPYSHRV